MLSALFSQLKLPFASKANQPNMHRKPLVGKHMCTPLVQKGGVAHVDFVSSSAFAQSCYDTAEDLARQAQYSDAAMACALLKDLNHPSLHSPAHAKCSKDPSHA